VTNKILIVLLYWEGDRAQAMKLARLLADLEAGHSARADFLFVARFDCKHDDDTIRYVSRKFNVFKHVSQRRGIGWPMGCNSIFFGALEWVYHKMAAKQIPHYRSILILGGDGAPLSRDWLSSFINESEMLHKKQVFVSGALVQAKEHGHDHINGDCMLLSGNLDFLRWLAVTVGDVSVSAGWDWVLAKEFENWGWKGLPFVKSVWNRRKEFTQADWDAEVAAGTVWFHGQKAYSLLNLGRKNLL
jgi:hypothetical protein